MALVFEVRERIHSDYVDQVDSLRVIEAGIDGMLDVLSEDDVLSLEQDWGETALGIVHSASVLLRRLKSWNHLSGKPSPPILSCAVQFGACSPRSIRILVI